jgi:hypothetical protein
VLAQTTYSKKKGTRGRAWRELTRRLPTYVGGETVSTQVDTRLHWICVQGQLSKRWAQWFEDMVVSIPPETTALAGVMVEQAALFDVLHKLYTLGLPLLLVRREED